MKCLLAHVRVPAVVVWLVSVLLGRPVAQLPQPSDLVVDLELDVEDPKSLSREHTRSPDIVPL